MILCARNPAPGAAKSTRISRAFSWRKIKARLYGPGSCAYVVGGLLTYSAQSPRKA
jgi:hypothetical protein